MTSNGELPTVEIYTDGACLGNPGPGGYAAILKFGGKQKVITGGYRLTTNNRMEIMAAIAGLTALKKNCVVNIYSDSRLLVDTMTKGWLQSWIKRGWRKKDGSPTLNPDLWQKLLTLTEKHQVSFHWIRGHIGDAENELCDKLSKQAAKEQNLPVDEVYEKTAENSRIKKKR
ncbi:ribonuclease HI [Candidatus Magnetomonas plexicatena]|uniref:ribonuclease HI n=1 Tax=Candidatus Magnetomonas plexicatena TaxID=2552947 RepID=UPI001C756C0D|nr:ribonuclease HI [Nitrospirales bacterium LBB_01]